MNENMISVTTRIFHPDQLLNMSLDDVLRVIKTGNFYGYDLIGITRKIQSYTDHDKQNELKYWNLPVALYNGTFSYKSGSNITDYSSYTALDFDKFTSEEELQRIGRRLVITPCVYAVFRTASGRGLKAIVVHDSNDPKNHEELFEQLLVKFNLPYTDSSVSDLSRGNYINYDPNLWINPNCVPYHFEHDPNYKPKKKDSSHNGLMADVRLLRWALSVTTVYKSKSDESVIAILNSVWRKKPELWKNGNRANAIFQGASQLCQAGVEIDKTIDYMIKSYLPLGMNEDEIRYQAIRGYQNNLENYGRTRAMVDSYGRKR